MKPDALKSVVLLLLLALPSFAKKGWDGILVDATCWSAKKPDGPAACPVTKDTDHYGVALNRGYLDIDQEGNLKVQAALVEARKKKGAYPEGSNIKVWVWGKRDGNRLTLQAVNVK